MPRDHNELVGGAASEGPVPIQWLGLNGEEAEDLRKSGPSTRRRPPCPLGPGNPRESGSSPAVAIVEWAHPVEVGHEENIGGLVALLAGRKSGYSHAGRGVAGRG
jgi:hypothetical protein